MSPLDNALSSVTSEVEAAVAEASASESTTTQQSTASGSDTTAAGTGSRAEAQAAEVDLGGENVLDVSRSEAGITDSDQATSDSTLLAIGGEEVIGSHADSAGTTESHAGDPLAPLCEGSGGQLCVRLLYADAYAAQDADSSSSLSQTGVADACLGGDSAAPTAECSGPVGAEVLTSEASMQRNTTDGSTSGTTESSVADLCLEPEAETCALGIRILWSQSSASSDGTTSGSSTLAALELGNEEVASLSDPASVDVQPGCAEPSAACVAANQGTAAASSGVAEVSQQALSAGVLPDTLEGQAGVAGTGVRATDEVLGVEAQAAGTPGSGAGASGDGDGTAGGGPGSPGTAVTGIPDTDRGVGERVTGLLPNTGGFWVGLLVIAGAALAAGSLLLTRSRRGAAV